MQDIFYKIKGSNFESQIERELYYMLDGYGKVYQSVHLYSHTLKRVTEIDLLVVTPKKIYCLEAKSFRSSLEGAMHMEMWNGKSNRYLTKIYNPYFQNVAHIRALKKAFYNEGILLPTIENFIVVPNSCRKRTDYRHTYKISELMTIVARDRYSGEEVLDVELFDKTLKKVMLDESSLWS